MLGNRSVLNFYAKIANLNFFLFGIALYLQTKVEKKYVIR